MNTHGRFPNSTRIPPRPPYCLRIVLALSCGLLLARAAGQQIVTSADSKELAPPGVSVAGVPIFSGVGNLDTWIAVRFEIQTDAVGVQGNIEASWLPFDAPAVTAARPVDLPPFSRQQFFLYCERIHAHCQMETGLRLPNGQLLGGQRFPLCHITVPPPSSSSVKRSTRCGPPRPLPQAQTNNNPFRYSNHPCTSQTDSWV